MELKRYLISLIKKVKDPETIIKIYLKVKEVIGGQDDQEAYHRFN